jgi:hypothetical protein
VASLCRDWWCYQRHDPSHRPCGAHSVVRLARARHQQIQFHQNHHHYYPGPRKVHLTWTPKAHLARMRPCQLNVAPLGWFQSCCPRGLLGRLTEEREHSWSWLPSDNHHWEGLAGTAGWDLAGMGKTCLEPEPPGVDGLKNWETGSLVGQQARGLCWKLPWDGDKQNPSWSPGTGLDLLEWIIKENQINKINIR